MKVETLNLHGHSLDEAISKLEVNLKWCIKHQVDVLDINHGKGLHSNRNFPVIKSEVRKLLENNTFIKNADYVIVLGESNLPIALTYDTGHTLVVRKGLEKSYIGGKKEVERNLRIYSKEGKKKRKMARKSNSYKRYR